MQTQTETNTQTTNSQNCKGEVVNSKPENGKCEGCGKTMQPIFIRCLFRENSFKWLKPASVCTKCVETAKMVDEKKSLFISKRRAIHAAFKNSNFSELQKLMTFKNFEITTENQGAFKIAKVYTPVRGDGLLIYGDSGAGKSHLAAAIANKFRSRHDVLFETCENLVNRIIESQFEENNRHDLLQIAKTVTLLVIDDISIKKLTEKTIEILFSIINYRTNHELATVVTTYLNLQQLKDKFGESIASRLIQLCRPVLCKTKENYRFKQRKQKKGKYDSAVNNQRDSARS